MKKVEHLGLASSEDDQANFRITLLETRVRELEHIVHGLLRDRVSHEEADAWLDIAGGQKSFTPTIKVVEGRGQRIAATLDRWPDKTKWPKREPL